MQTEHVDAAMAAVGHKTALVGSFASFISVLTTSQAGVAFGIAGVIGGLLIQWYFNRKRDKREEAQDARAQQEHELRMTLRGDTLE